MRGKWEDPESWLLSFSGLGLPTPNGPLSLWLKSMMNSIRFLYYTYNYNYNIIEEKPRSSSCFLLNGKLRQKSKRKKNIA